MDNIDKYIEEHKKMEHSPYLESRILTSIERLKVEQSVTHSKTPTRLHLVIAANFIFIVALGITIGSSYKSTKESYGGGILVNDTYVEQLSMYEDYEDE